MVKAKRPRKSSLDQSHDFRPANFEFVSAEITGVPFCEHGPTMLFERMKNGKLEKFYACAVCRSRKDCAFHRTFDEECRHPMTSTKINLMKKIMKKRRQFTHKDLYERLKSFRKLPLCERLFCTECSILLSSIAERAKHRDDDAIGKHRIVHAISNRQLREPSTLLKLSENNQKEAQFMFSRSTLTFLADNITKMEFDGVVCLGTPRLMEFLQRPAYKSKCRSFLLDIDYRYAHFWSPRFFAQFNMFNGYFYTTLGEKCFNQFASQVKKILIVVDPPYGGLVTPLVNTLQRVRDRIESEYGKCEIILVSPYFMEHKISGAMPQMKILDYKVSYEGNKFSTPDGGSYVRMFTTLDRSLVEIPASLGYKYCEKCQRYVSHENRHCDICNECTSKDGRSYAHCEQCGKCVKDRYEHCKQCDHCHQPKSTKGATCRRSIVCELCHGKGHVWVNCPSKSQFYETSNTSEEQDSLGVLKKKRKVKKGNDMKNESEDKLMYKKGSKKRKSVLKRE